MFYIFSEPKIRKNYGIIPFNVERNLDFEGIKL